ncbi:PAS domain-containing protein [Salipiger sp. P9]|uniref:PAS domain-containing protein n=1 Tax=Salipiger pentaromativorans TaxID=2943193 RepID=UPI002157D769|nr:PAS domain-containing protein [Salipiger pentaromativorans]MCR8548036.1 PAS domain-containing protein [Salipiger pentaromativorans]
MSQHDPQLISQTRNSGLGEVPFEASSMFYSRTDERGVIIEGNSIFRRISGYGWAELKGAPHKIIRHPDMPKGVFHLYWERLKNGQQVAAYVKNRAKDGRHYWVLAIAWPIAGGYLSVRVKPHTQLFAQVRELYAELRQAELEEGVTPAKSAEMLQARLAEQGFEHYEAFMAGALSLELEERARRMGVPLDQRQQRFLTMVRTIAQIKQETDEMTEVIKAIRTVPMNMRILASRLENAGGPISAISVNYGSMLDEMASWVRGFVEGRDSTYVRMRETIQRGQFLMAAAIMQREMSSLFEEDMKGAPDTSALVEDRMTLQSQATAFSTLAGEALKVVETEATRLGRSVLDMKRYVTGLSSTRMMCKIESAALSGSGDSLSGIVDQLDAGQDEIEARLAKIVELNTVIQSNTAMLRAIT